MDLHSLTIDELRKLNESVLLEIRNRGNLIKYTFHVGMAVYFISHKTGREVHGKLIKINRTRAHVETAGMFGEKLIFTVPFSLLKKLDKQPASMV